MHIDLDTFLVAVYTTIDELYSSFFSHLKPSCSAALPRMTDSEVITLAVLAQWDLRRSERFMLRYANKHWSSYFPKIITQSAFNKRVRYLAGVMCMLVPLVAEKLAAWSASYSSYKAIDSVVVPIMKKFRGNDHRLFANEADVGLGGSDKSFYYGFRILSEVDSSGFISGFVIGAASAPERFLAEAMFRFRDNSQAEMPTPENMEQFLGKSNRKGGKRTGLIGPINVSGIGKPSDHYKILDLGFSGKKWKEHWLINYNQVTLTNDIYDEVEKKRECKKWINRLRHVIETKYSWLEGEFGLNYCKARSYHGFIARVGAKLIGYNISVGINHKRGVNKFKISDLNPFQL
jgi:hypothetical protein